MKLKMVCNWLNQFDFWLSNVKRPLREASFWALLKSGFWEKSWQFHTRETRFMFVDRAHRKEFAGQKTLTSDAFLTLLISEGHGSWCVLLCLPPSLGPQNVCTSINICSFHKEILNRNKVTSGIPWRIQTHTLWEF